MAVVASANGIHNGTERSRLKNESGEVGQRKTGRVRLLPGENPGEFRERMTGLFDSLRPRNQFEISLVERAFLVEWRLDRFIRAEWARLYLRAHTRAIDEQSRVEAEVRGLTIRLMRAPYGRPTALPFGEPLEGQAPSKQVQGFEDADHPRNITRALEASGPGCKWLLKRWGELEEMLSDEKGLGWEGPERFRVYRLLGIHWSNATFSSELTELFRACEVIDPGAGSLAGEIWNEFLPTDGRALIEKMYQRAMSEVREMDLATARGHLLTIIKRETTRIEQSLERHETRAKLEAEVGSDRSALDDSRDGMKMMRYEFSCEKLYLRYLDELRKHRAEKTQKSEAYNAAYYRPSPSWFEEEGRVNNRAGDEERKPEGVGFDGADSEVARSLESEFNSDWCPDSDHEDVAVEGMERVVAAEEGIVNAQPAKAVVDRPRLGPGYLNKPVTGSKREKRRLRRLERESMAKAGRKG